MGTYLVPLIRGNQGLDHKEDDLSGGRLVKELDTGLDDLVDGMQHILIELLNLKGSQRVSQGRIRRTQERGHSPPGGMAGACP